MARRKRKGEAAAVSTEPLPTPSAGETAAVWVALEDLTGWKDNPRDITPEHVADIAHSIRRFGFGEPIVAREANREIIAGHARMLAAQQLRLASVPVRYLDLDAAEAHLLAIADNKLGEQGTWNEELLRANVGMLASAGEDMLTGTGFGQAEIDALSLSVADLGDSPQGLDEGPPAAGEARTYSVVIQCHDETEQQQLLARLGSEGLRARGVVG